MTEKSDFGPVSPQGESDPAGGGFGRSFLLLLYLKITRDQ